MAEPLRHRQTKEAGTDMFDLPLPRHISTLPWPCRNSSVLHQARRRNSAKFRVMKFTYSAQIRLDTVLENCIFYIPSRYEFLHSQGQTRTSTHVGGTTAS